MAFCNLSGSLILGYCDYYFPFSS